MESRVWKIIMKWMNDLEQRKRRIKDKKSNNHQKEKEVEEKKKTYEVAE